jgi:hypothetical protein
MSIESYLSRMSRDDVWPAAHSPKEAKDALYDVADFEAGVLRWSSNGRCPHDDMLAAWLVLEVITMAQAEATSAARRAEDARFIEEYRSADPVPDGEQIAEMRAAFGQGATVVNVITGRKTNL